MNKLEHFDFKESLYLLSIYAFLKLILDDASLFWACSTHKSTEKYSIYAISVHRTTAQSLVSAVVLCLCQPKPCSSVRNFSFTHTALFGFP